MLDGVFGGVGLVVELVAGVIVLFVEELQKPEPRFLKTLTVDFLVVGVRLCCR